MAGRVSTLVEPQENYAPQDALGETLKSGAMFGAAGLLVSAVQNSLSKKNVGALGVFTRYGANIGYFAGAGASYTFFSTASANLRQRNDTYNTAFGGFIAGATMGLRARTMPSVIGTGVMVSVIMSAFDYTGGSLGGYGKDPEVDEFERKQNLRKNRRRPIDETIAELGEGRGIYGPGYEERRRQRIKENYGIDVTTASSQS